ncbi:hypothetical protein LPJ63_003641 [Coemansia sp. RSA 2711]|nr:hypothetical protein LPJ63_003641 [Coemansia sp. RSA 2711]
MLGWACVVLALLLAAHEYRGGTSHRRLQRRQADAQSEVPDYVLVSPEHVALAPSAAGGLDASAINDITCLVNRFRYDNGLAPLALDAQLVRHAQARAELLARDKAVVSANVIAGDTDPLAYNASVWSDVRENILRSELGPTQAYWDMQQSGEMAGNLNRSELVSFGAGFFGGYYVQALGTPVQMPDDDMRALAPWCPSNETFWSWVFPAGAPAERADSGQQLIGHDFPYAQFADAPQYYNPDYPAAEAGLAAAPSFYFTPAEGSVPYLRDLAVADTVAGADSPAPFAATAASGELGMTAAQLNLLVCLVNARRYDACLAPVALHPQLIATAQAHSYEMNRARNMSHHGSAGDLGARAKLRGFEYSAIGENVGYGTHDPFQTFIGFAESQMHLDNMLNPAYAFVGAGRSGQYWTMTLGAYMNQSNTPARSSLPLCPGSDVDVQIAFPAGLPAEPRLETKACGATEATSVAVPPEVQSLVDALDASQSADDASSSQTSDVSESSDYGGDESESNESESSDSGGDEPEGDESGDESEGDDESEHSESDHNTDSDHTRESNPNSSSTITVVQSTSTSAPEPAPSSNRVTVIIETQIVIVTVFVDGDALAARSRCTLAPTSSSSEPDSFDSDYSPTTLDTSDFDIIIHPENLSQRV